MREASEVTAEDGATETSTSDGATVFVSVTTGISDPTQKEVVTGSWKTEDATVGRAEETSGLNETESLGSSEVGVGLITGKEEDRTTK